MAGLFGLGKPQQQDDGAGARASPSKHPRQSSGSYNVFDPLQIQTFKEAFSMIDVDMDGFVSRSDVHNILSNLGLDNSRQKVDAFFSSPSAIRSGSPTKLSATEDRIPFATFVSMFADRMQDMDAEHDLVEAFACLDDSDAGWIDGQELRNWLKQVGDRMSDQEIDRLVQGPFMDKRGRFHYRDFCATLRVTEGEPVPPLA